MLFDEFVWHGQKLFASKVNGEFGWFANVERGLEPYVPFFGPSEMSLAPGRIVTADWWPDAVKPEAFYFIRQTTSGHGVNESPLFTSYIYNPRERSIRQLAESTLELVPWKLRKSGSSLLVWGQTAAGIGEYINRRRGSIDRGNSLRPPSWWASASSRRGQFLTGDLETHVCDR